MMWTTYKEKVQRLSQRIVEVQRPIRVLDAIKWDDSIEEEFKKSGYKELPKIDSDYYSQTDLRFDPDKKISELKEIHQDIIHTLGKDDALGKLMQKIVDQYIDVVHLLLARGTKKFLPYSHKLYGSPKDQFFGDKNTIVDLGKLLYQILSKLYGKNLGREYPKTLDAESVVNELNRRFKLYFHEDGGVKAMMSDGIVADAAAGGETVKIKSNARFSERDINILEVHEGWVHVNTTINGNRQPIARWLSKGPPRCATTQEGLAVLMEIITFNSYPRRARGINDRILAIDKVEDGADFLELFEFFRTEGYSEDECFYNCMRVFRGGMVKGGVPFTKDIAYCKGFVENYNFIRAAIRLGKPELIPFLFVGKIHVDDIPLLYQKHLEGVVEAPFYLPPNFQDLNGLAIWMSFSSFFNLVDLERIQEHYHSLFSQHL